MDRIIQLQEVERLRAAGQLTEAYMLCKYAYDKEPENVDILLAMASLAIDLGYFEAAETLSHLAVSYDPGRAQAWLFWAQALAVTGDDAQAEQADRLSQLDETAYAKLRLDRSKELIREGKIEKARRLLAVLLSSNPKHVEARKLLSSLVH